MTKKQTQSKKKTTTSVKQETKNTKEATVADIEAAIKNASSLPEEDDLQAQLAEAQQSAKDNWDKVVRAQAEMENLKRRNAKDLENAHKFALDGFVKALLEVKDSLSMGLKTAHEDTATIESIIEGLEMTDKVFLSTMVKFGVESINPEGEPFNPELHEAITMLPMPDKESNTVLDVVQVGFTLNGRLVRPAMVVVVQ
ncbi:nucleotide exchange factor GrpE [bacterium endosymbiont of Bathymodiolus sp. 5 South]|jgi:molecular chaperone GrpE|uniref:nucleotide exchange factor GrpE n=1 Tax=bacterium endosymbiont of Bathymodiolus sp. 5 South TaxID=1181670 RepID=UPI0010BC74D4|nr:nucleotide exchange factor GrpE [bacterium endosymbiont of Bathymodiolus sp. 5 South]CAC9435496.1 Heat shock protein GrpE [uncultured Gammaproteobacteria bacterium]CAC9653954.1 Heat shock protein GrpE [uncultured Gammaproteobacteria bacterium]CAC9659432.1 Heat shock protein GrpE [uncultured Gammaproteobacteria bacterium]SHN91603.1 Heat shock protein GrpE [bacterium endosymbiont of Bathymodiolus sp. 5 South]SSC07383.1 Heat shock protein GrpE [bacterium endosymbiont of Bathymodiolus sp. 5 Sou